ncbi:MAG: hypothetical protein ACI92E_001606 [Oceanicoccus sp.]|jgi:hypothetical protein
MSTEFIVAIIGISLLTLVAIALTMQSLEKSRKEKKRLLGLLNSRVRNFEYMLNNFPEGFLGRDLQILVCKSLQEVFHQLGNVNPRDKSNTTNFKQLEQKISVLSNRAATEKNVTLTDKQQIVEIQKLLKHLYSFIAKLTSSKRISNNDSQRYASQIRKLMLQTTTDSLNQAISEAIKIGKFPLALHNLKMAIDKLTKENTGGIYSEKIAHYEQQISDISALNLPKKDPVDRQETDDDKVWEEMKKPDDTWKKNAIYD